MTGFAYLLIGSPRLYDRVQKIFGLEDVRRRIARALSSLEPGSLLDVGAGTGNFYPVVPAGFEYIALDRDETKLRHLRQKFPNARTVCASGTDIPFEDRGVDYTLCVAVSHHLADNELDRLIAELARVTRYKLVFVDALNVPRVMSRLLWAGDRGTHPRSLDVLSRALEQCFVFEQIECFRIHHSYFMAVAAVRIPELPSRDEPGA
jgi:SAM-dependent methyltransferase